MIKIIKPFVYGLYLWVRHFESSKDSIRMWHYLSNDYIAFIHTATLITKGNRLNYPKLTQLLREMKSLESKLISDD